MVRDMESNADAVYFQSNMKMKLTERLLYIYRFRVVGSGGEGEEEIGS